MDRIKRFGSEVAYFFKELKQQSYDLFFGEFSVKAETWLAINSHGHQMTIKIWVAK